MILNMLLDMIPNVKKIKDENFKLQKENQKYYKMYLEEKKKAEEYRDVLKKIKQINSVNKEKAQKQEKITDVKKLEFTKKEKIIEDDVCKQAEFIVNRNTFGMAGKDYTGEPVKYQELTEEMIEELFQYCYNNPTKEVNLELGQSINGRITGILETHTDKELGVEIYEEEKHLQSLKTGTKIINDEVVNDYNEEDIMRVLKSYGKRRAVN